MWKQITKEQIKDYPIGTKVRIGDRQETVIASHYGRGDYAFDTEDRLFYWDSGFEPYPYVFGETFGWSNHKVEVWEEEPLTSLEGIYVDTTDLDEDTCKRLVDTFVSQGYRDNTLQCRRSGFKVYLQVDYDDVCYFMNTYGNQEVTPKQVFDFVSKNSSRMPEDNNVEKINDLINKYFAKNTTLSLAEFLDDRGVKV